MKKGIAMLLTVAMTAALVVGCGSSSESSSASAPAEKEETKTEAPVEIGADKVDENVNYLEKLLEVNDGLSLSGIQSPVQEDRSGIEKALQNIGTKDDLVIGWLGASLGSDFFTAWMDATKQMAAERGWTLLESNAQFDMEVQNTQMDSYVQQGVDVIVLNAVRLDAQVAQVKAAVEAGIPVICAGPTPGQTEYPVVTTVISGSLWSGFLVGQYAAEQMYSQDKALQVGYVGANFSDGDTNSRGCGFISGYLYKSAEMNGEPYADRYAAVLDGFNIWQEFKNSGSYDASDFGLNLVGYGQGGGTDAAAGQVASSDLLTAHPEMELIIVETDTMVSGVISECKMHDAIPGTDIQLMTCADGTANVCNYIEEGSVMASALNSPYFYSQGVFAALDAMFGPDAGNLDVNNLTINQYCPTELITKDNITTTYPRAEDDVFATPTESFSIYTVDEWNAENE